MRVLQVTVFALGGVALLAALAFVGSVTGDALWRAGIAVLLLDIVCIKLWPRSPRGPGTPPGTP